MSVGIEQGRHLTVIEHCRHYVIHYRPRQMVNGPLPSLNNIRI
jgi:hypothetical protein